MTRGLALLLCVGALVAAACRTGVLVIDTGPKPPTQDGTIAGHVSTGGGAAGTYTLKVPPGKYRIEVELRAGERLVKQPGETDVHKSDLDPNRDFELTAGGG